jgi:hypothetical protein
MLCVQKYGQIGSKNTQVTLVTSHVNMSVRQFETTDDSFYTLKYEITYQFKDAGMVYQEFIFNYQGVFACWEMGQIRRERHTSERRNVVRLDSLCCVELDCSF